MRTYDDAIAAVNNLQQILAQVSSALNLSTPSTQLTTPELALLQQLTNKHRGDTQASQARIAELTDQLQQLSDMLKPLAGQPIANEGGLRGLLIDTIKHYRDQVKDIADMSKLNVQLVNTETTN